MNFSYNADQLAIADSIGKCLDRLAGAWPDAGWNDASQLTNRLMPALGELGIFGLLVQERQGGVGLSVVDIVPALVEAGRRISPVPLVESVLAASIMAEAAPAQIAPVVAGKELASVAWSGELVLSDSTQPRLSGQLASVGFGGMSRWVLATVAADNGGRGLVLLDTSAPGVHKRAKAGFDLSFPLGDITVRDVACSPASITWNKFSEFRSAGIVLYCAELVGVASACLERSRQHLAERRQFGKPLASNQALRHMVADDLVALESGRLAVDYAGWALVCDPIGVARAVSVAKAYVSRTALDIAENAIQIHGAMGFTWTSPLHLMLRRILRCASTLGTASEHHERLASDFLAENMRSATYA